MIPEISADEYKESLRLSNRLDITEEHKHLWAELEKILEREAYTVQTVTERWFYVTSGDNTLQLEIDPKGSNLDIVIIDEYTQSLGNGFPLGGSWAEKSCVKLVEGNLDFAKDRIAQMFAKAEEAKAKAYKA